MGLLNDATSNTNGAAISAWRQSPANNATGQGLKTNSGIFRGFNNRGSVSEILEVQQVHFACCGWILMVMDCKTVFL